MKKIYITVNILFASLVVLGQEPLWQQSGNGEKNETVYGSCQLPTGGFALVGSANDDPPASKTSAFLYITDTEGAIVKTTSFGDGAWNYAFAADTTADDHIVVAGGKRPANGNWNVIVAKFDLEGGLVSGPVSFGGSGKDIAYGISVASDGKIALAGLTDSQGNGGTDAFLLILNNDLSGSWSNVKTFGGSDNDRAVDVKAVSNGFILSGNSSSQGKTNFFMVKTNSSGSETWSESFGASESDDIGGKIAEISNGSYAMAGYTSFGPNQFRPKLVKTNGSSITANASLAEIGSNAVIGIASDDDSLTLVGSKVYDIEGGRFYNYVIRAANSGTEGWEAEIGSSPNSGLYTAAGAYNGSLVAGRIKEQGNDQAYWSKFGRELSQEIQVVWVPVYHDDNEWDDVNEPLGAVCEIEIIRAAGKTRRYAGRTDWDGKLLVKGIEIGDLIYARQVYWQVKGEAEYEVTQINNGTITIELSPEWNSKESRNFE